VEGDNPGSFHRVGELPLLFEGDEKKKHGEAYVAAAERPAELFVLGRWRDPTKGGKENLIWKPMLVSGGLFFKRGAGSLKRARKSRRKGGRTRRLAEAGDGGKR